MSSISYQCYVSWTESRIRSPENKFWFISSSMIIENGVCTSLMLWHKCHSLRKKQLPQHPPVKTRRLKKAIDLFAWKNIFKCHLSINTCAYDFFLWKMAISQQSPQKNIIMFFFLFAIHWTVMITCRAERALIVQYEIKEICMIGRKSSTLTIQPNRTWSSSIRKYFHIEIYSSGNA